MNPRGKFIRTIMVLFVFFLEIGKNYHLRYILRKYFLKYSSNYSEVLLLYNRFLQTLLFDCKVNSNTFFLSQELYIVNKEHKYCF